MRFAAVASLVFALVGSPVWAQEADWQPVRPRPVLPRAQQPASRIGDEALKATATPPHHGIMGLAWGKTPAEARSILGPKLKFIAEKAADEEVYQTLDQHYQGDFAGMPTADIVLRFYQGHFFYLMVTLATKDGGSAADVFEDARARMRAAYGPGKRYVAPMKLASAKAVAAKAQNPELTGELRDFYIRSHVWDPFEGWRFANDVTVQTFVFEQFTKDHAGGTLKPLWIFCKKDVFDRWKREIVAATLVEPRDF